ncbi:MAG: hypothetical protein CV087_18000 [Candidatus Brocadia sp. WS118]|nr:MAG: hypothetical protein CV087_18000 [Candidatus Brocadia sp. WS118]
MDNISYYSNAATKRAVSRVRYPCPLPTSNPSVYGGTQGGRVRNHGGNKYSPLLVGGGELLHKKKLRAIFSFVIFLCMGFGNLLAKDLSDKEYIIGPEDVLEIQVWDNEDLGCVTEVSLEGAFTFPLIGRVRAGGLSITGLERLIEEKLADGYLISPHVNVSVKEYKSQKVSILGAVKNPGSYALKRKTDILEVISQAGGFTDKAGQIITIVRPKPTQQNGHITHSGKEKENAIITLDLSDFKASSAYDNFPVMNGDSIYVNLAPRIFVTGEVKKAGEFPWEKGLTVRQAISLAGGHTDKASPRRVIISRMEDGKEKELKPKMDDLVIPGDIIKIPGRYF